MQIRQLWLLNVVLAVVAVLMAARIRSDWKDGNARYAQLAQRSAVTAPIPVVSGPELSLTPVAEIVSKNLFMPDRSSERPEASVLQTTAPLPIVIGTMRLGADYEALMSEAGQPGPQRFRRIKTGEQIGPYTVIEIRDEAVVVEFQGRQTVVNVYQSAKSVLRAAATPEPPPVRTPIAPVVDSMAAPTPPAAATPAPQPKTGAAPVAIGDVKVTIEGNRRRYERWSMFGPQVWYEDIK